MTREQAMQRLQQLLGKKARFRVGKGISSPEKRAQAQAKLEAVRAELAEKYKAVRAQLAPLQSEERALAAAARAYKFWIYRSEPGSIFALEVGKGDTWEEAFASMARFASRRTKDSVSEADGRAS